MMKKQNIHIICLIVCIITCLFLATAVAAEITDEGVAVTVYSLELLGLGLILAALYLQGRETRERFWTVEGTLDRVLGKAPLNAPEKKGA